MQLELIDTKKDNEMIELRESFVTNYCNEKGWDIYDLSFEQILEIRSHKQWINPGLMLS